MAIFGWWKRRHHRITAVLQTIVEQLDLQIQTTNRQSAESQQMALDLTKLIAALVRATSAVDKLTTTVKAQSDEIAALNAALAETDGQTDVDKATADLIAVADKAEAATPKT